MDSDEYSKSALEAIGFQIEKLIEPGDRKEADFLGYFEGKKYIIEAKIKTDSPEILTEREETLSRGDVFVAESKLGRDENISQVIRSAAHQLRSSAKVHEHDFRILFMACIGINATSKMDRAIDTLYGRTQIMEVNKKPLALNPCYFYRHAEFYRRRDQIDAALVAHQDLYGKSYVLLCLNTLSKNYSALNEEKLVAKFLKSKIDPIHEERAGLAYIPDEGFLESKAELGRAFSLDNPMLLHLKEKYKTNFLVNIDFETPEISIRT